MSRAQNTKKDHPKVDPIPKTKKAEPDGTSYDTSKKETATPQKVREGNESAGEHARNKKAKGK